MTERPIIMTGESVRGILDGRKMQTRQAVTRGNSQPDDEAWPRASWASLDFSAAWVDPNARGCLGPCLKVPRPAEDTVHRVYSRLEVGDRLWVRETWARENPYSDGGESCPVAYRADLVWGTLDGLGRFFRHGFVIDGSGRHPWPDSMRGDSRGMAAFGDRWRSPRYMSRRASRITLDVTGVRVERVQDISEDDAIAEGVNWDPISPDPHDARLRFAALWDRINAKRGFSWESNPWVWVIEFKRLEAADG